jgi:diacylglycerol kinase family enzyme
VIGPNSVVRSAVVVNPLRVADPAEYRERITAALAAAGWAEPLWLETTAEDPGTGQTGRAVAEGAEVVFVCGGDGTVMACVHALVGTEVALAVLPSGTGNLLAANVGLESDLDAAVQVALDGGRRHLDVGVVGDRYFTVMAGMGFDAHMIDATSDGAKLRLGWLAYVVAGARHLRDRPMRVTIRLDGGPPLRRRARTVLVGNVGRLQGGVRLLPDAVPDDGRLDVAVLSPRTVRHWLALGWAVLRRRRRVPRMEVYTAERIEVRSDRVQPRELDGDLIEPANALEVRVRPRALWLCVPRPAQSPDLAEGAEEAAEEAAGG